MRIAQVAPLYESVPPRLYGGTERVVSWLTEKLVEMGHDVTLFASADSVSRARLVPMCKQALRLNPDCIDPLAHHMLLVDEVLRQAPGFDIIHFHIDYLHFPYFRREQAITLTTLHGRLDIPDLVPLYREFRDVPLVSISDAQRKPLAQANWIGTVHHGMPSELLGCREGGDYLAFLGRISPEKGLDRAIEIAIRVGRKLKIAAKVDRADQDYYEQKIKHLLDHPLIEFIGEIGNGEKEDFLGNAAALLFPINWPEPFGLVMIEAMACGTPVIAYPKGSVPEIIQHGVNGYIVHNVEQAVDAVRHIDDLDRKECRRHFERYFTDERMASDYLAIYNRMIGRASGEISLEKGVLQWIEVESPTPSTT